MRRTRIRRRPSALRQEQQRQERYAFPLDPRDPDAVRAKSLRPDVVRAKSLRQGSTAGRTG